MFKNMYEAERAIQELIEKDNNCSTHFNYTTGHVNYNLELVTYNPVHKSHFLLHSTTGKTQVAALNKMYTHLIELKETLKHKDSPLLNYTVEWYSHSEAKRFRSSFYGRDIEQVVDKFYYGKTKACLTIHNIKLNPSS